ncbi:MAG: T9SS type A sorting domain-containing protein, partial [Chlorobi bacterium]|nr:T9SS type A sorting domain-containing protein [Chlorobiota bacterium]
YIILQKAGASAPTSNPADGTGYAVSDVIGDGTVAAIITNTAATTSTISSLTQGTQYSFKIIPFNWDLTNPETYNYDTVATIPTATQTTYYQSNTFTGNGNWNSSSNWSNGEVPYSGADATISDTVTVTANATINNITLSVGSDVTVNDGITLTVSGNMTISADATGTASYVENGTGTVSVSGTMTAQVYVDGFNYHYISSPVTSETVGNVLTGYYVKMYNESNAVWDYGSTSTVMTPGKGFNVRYSSGNHTLSFTGTLNTGSVSYSTTADNTDGWNLVGNPYPSAIDWDASSGWTKTNVLNGIYFYDGTQYATYINGSGTNGGTRYIPPSQGFFISTSSAGTIGMTNAVRVHNTQAFWKNGANSKLNNVLKLQVSGNSYTDDIVIRFMDSATTAFDNDYDAYKWSSGIDSIPELFTKDNANNDLSINTQPVLTGSWSTPIGFNIGKVGSYTISATEYENFSATTAIYLEDLYTGTLINLKEKSYTFTSDIVNDTNRFIVHFYPSSNIWSGNSTDWNSSTNWENGTIPASGNIAIIPGTPTGGKHPIVSSNSDCNDLVLLPNATLTIESGKTLTVNGDLIINANASFIDNGTLVVNGNSIIEKQIEKDRWWYLTSPINDATSKIFDATNTDHLLYYWNESNTGTHGWNQIIDNNTDLFGSALPIMNGYATKFKNTSATLKYNGSINTGNQTINVTRTIGVDKEGFNLIGNPYPSAINWDTASVTKTNIDNILWYRTNGTFADYNGNSGIGTNGGQKYIPAMQAFWVKVSDGQTSGSISLTNDARLHITQAFYKNNNTDKKLIRLSVGIDLQPDETVIAFIDGAKTGFDKFDTEKMLVDNSDVPLIFSHALTGTKNLSLNSFPLTFDNITVPLSINSPENTTSIYVTELSNFNTNEGVFLEDLLTGDMINLKTENSYEFSGGANINNNRFLIHFTTLDTYTTNDELNLLNIFSSSQYIFIQNNSNVATNINIKVFDLLGKIIINKTINLTNTEKIRVNKTGVYIVKIIDGNNIYRKEVFIN